MTTTLNVPEPRPDAADALTPATTVDLAARALGGAVIAANDDAFAPKEHLIEPYPVTHRPRTFGPQGQHYDGWETRRRRDDGHDWAIVRLAIPGTLHTATVDTAHFNGNHPPAVSIDACRADGHPTLDDLHNATWHTLVPRTDAHGDTANTYPVHDPRRYTHVRLNLHPDGGVARLRIHGTPRPDPAHFADLPLDLAALTNGATVTDASNAHYSDPVGAIMPGLPANQADGWETARRRTPGNEWLRIRLAGRGTIRIAEIDTTHLKHNAPAAASIDAYDGDTAFTLLEPTPLRPDAPHRFRIDTDRPATAVRLNVFPDGGIARIRLYGRLTDEALAELHRRFAD